MTTIAFLRFREEAPFVPGVLSEKYPYSVSLKSKVRSPTLVDAEFLKTSAHIQTPQKRVQLGVIASNGDIVDQFFRVRYTEAHRQELAVETWSQLVGDCKKIQWLSGTLAVGLTLLALKGPPLYIVVASFVGAVVSTCIFGGSLHRYHIAEKELAVWQSPGEDFARKRKAALDLSLHKMIEKKCHFHPKQLTGTLLGVEILSVFRRDFKQFATSLLAKTCDTPDLQHQWVLDFFKGNPLTIEFFKENPHLESEQEWKIVLKFQKQVEQLLKLMQTLHESHVPQFQENQAAAEQKYEDIRKSISENAEVFFERQQFVPLRANLYCSRILPILKTECLDKISALEQKENTKAEFFGSLVYLQVRALLEEAQKGLLEDQPYALDEAVFTDPGKFVLGNFQEELNAATVNYPQNVIEKAKAEAPEEAEHYKETYRTFINAAFQV